MILAENIPMKILSLVSVRLSITHAQIKWVEHVKLVVFRAKLTFKFDLNDQNKIKRQRNAFI